MVHVECTQKDSLPAVRRAEGSQAFVLLSKLVHPSKRMIVVATLRSETPQSALNVSSTEELHATMSYEHM